MPQRDLWTGELHTANPFAAPRGLFGRLAGRLMARLNRAQNEEIAGILAVGSGDRVLEVGCGPGVLLGLLMRATDGEVVGVDPSPDMVAMARRRNRATVGADRLTVRTGSAAETGEADGSVDLVVSVNTVAMWPRLAPGVAELHRVLRPGGRVVITWHGGSEPSRMARSMVLRPDQAEAIRAALRERFGDVEDHEGRTFVAFTATRD